MPRITINLTDDDQVALDYICAHNRRTRSEQVSRWVSATLSGELVETPRYELADDMPLELTQAEADAIMATMTPDDFQVLGEDGRTVLDKNGNVIGELSAACAHAVAASRLGKA